MNANNFLTSNPKELHFMVDIETLDTAVTASITEIGAVVINPPKGCGFSPMFYQHCLDPEGSTSNATLAWRTENNLLWYKVTEQEAHLVKNYQLYIKNVLENFFTWISEQCQLAEATPIMWCKGTDFDKRIIECAAQDRCGIQELPWAYNKFFDLRTLLYIFPQFKVPKELVKHTGLEDALQQASCLIRIAEHLAELRSDAGVKL